MCTAMYIQPCTSCVQSFTCTTSHITRTTYVQSVYIERTTSYVVRTIFVHPRYTVYHVYNVSTSNGQHRTVWVQEEHVVRPVCVRLLYKMCTPYTQCTYIARTKSFITRTIFVHHVYTVRRVQCRYDVLTYVHRTYDIVHHTFNVFISNQQHRTSHVNNNYTVYTVRLQRRVLYVRRAYNMCTMSHITDTTYVRTKCVQSCTPKVHHTSRVQCSYIQHTTPYNVRTPSVQHRTTLVRRTYTALHVYMMYTSYIRVTYMLCPGCVHRCTRYVHRMYDVVRHSYNIPTSHVRRAYIQRTTSYMTCKVF